MEEPIVTIKQGQLRGCIRTDIDGGKIYSFLGIPFAEPPIGELRFKAPVPAKPWVGVRDATQDGHHCYSRDLFERDLGGTEDCLHLNVFTKSLPGSGTSLKPVMVWIHGGGFLTGSNKSNMYGPEFLLTQDVVLVSINYRLGALGFLSSEDESLEIPGNAGLKDQTLGLKWVQENIKNFNGDPNNVTIFGESAGSCAVHYQILSPTARGLFHKAILQSGSTLNSWAEGKRVLQPLVKLLGHDVASDKEAFEILKSVPMERLHDAQEQLEETRKASQKGNFAPIIEKPNDTAFITESPIDIIRSGNYNKVPLMVGYTTREGLLFAVYDEMAAREGRTLKKSPPNLEDAIPWQVGLEQGSDASKQAAASLANLYFKNPHSPDNIHLLSTDSAFLAGIMASVKNHVETSQNPVYLYRMSLEAGLNIVKHYGKLKFSGTCHGDDLGYLFKNMMTPPLVPGSIEETSIRRFVKLWTNFAKCSNPTPDETDLGITWPPATKENINFLDIGEELTTGINPETERMQLWRQIFQLNPNTAHFL